MAHSQHLMCCLKIKSSGLLERRGAVNKIKAQV
jgi:hypothetical protein